MVELTPDRDPTISRQALQVPEPEFPTKTPAGRRSSAPAPTSAPGGQPDPSPASAGSSTGQPGCRRRPGASLPMITNPVITNPVITSPAVAAQVLCHQFLANADRGDHAANDALVTELVRRIRTSDAGQELGCLKK